MYLYFIIVAALIILCSKTGQALIQRLIKDLFAIIKTPGEILHKISLRLLGKEDMEEQLQEELRKRKSEELKKLIQKGGDGDGREHINESQISVLARDSASDR